MKKLGIFTAKYYGDIILNPEFKNKVYSRGVYVTTANNIGFGYNLDLALDRDRNYIPNFQSFESKARSIIIYILEHYLEYKDQIDKNQLEQMDFTEIEMFDKFPEQIINLLDKNYTFLGSQYFNISSKTADFLWELNAQLRRETDKKFMESNMELVPQPIYQYYYFSSFVRDKNLSEDFYPYFICKEPLYDALKNSKYYISYQTKFEKFYKAKKTVTITPTKDNKIEKTINSIVAKIRLFDYSFNRNSIVFKELESEETHFTDNDKYYFSSLLLDKPEKMEIFVFGKCLEKLNVDMVDLLKKFDFVVKY